MFRRETQGGWWRRWVLSAMGLLLAVVLQPGSVLAQCCELEGTTVFDYSDQLAAFGTSFAISGENAVFGGPSGGPVDQGAVVFLHKNGAWQSTPPVVASDSESLAAFGAAVAMDAGTVVVGAPRHDSIEEDAGQAYVFEAQSGDPPSWVEQQILSPPTPPFETEDFGRAVAIQGNTITIGSPENLNGQGAVAVFDRVDDTWQPTSILQSPNPGEANHFGTAVALSGDVLLVGEAAFSEPGMAHVFRRQPGGSWQHEATLTGTVMQGGDRFGTAVAIDGNADVAVIGAHTDNDAGLFTGAAYIFRYDGSSWTMEQKLFPCDPGIQQYFGWSVAIDSSTVVIGAPALTGVGGNGRTYYLRWSGSQWQTEAELVQSTFAQFGASVGVDGLDAFGGGLRDGGTAGGELSGVVAFDLGQFCPADVTGDGIVDVQDLSAVILAWGTSDPDADVNCDGTVDVQDLISVIMHWGEECVLQTAPENFWECVDRCGNTDPNCIVGCGEMFGLFE